MDFRTLLKLSFIHTHSCIKMHSETVKLFKLVHNCFYRIFSGAACYHLRQHTSYASNECFVFRNMTVQQVGGYQSF